MFPKQHQPLFAGQPGVDEEMGFHKLNPNQPFCCNPSRFNLLSFLDTLVSVSSSSLHQSVSFGPSRNQNKTNFKYCCIDLNFTSAGKYIFKANENHV